MKIVLYLFNKGKLQCLGQETDTGKMAASAMTIAHDSLSDLLPSSANIIDTSTQAEK